MEPTEFISFAGKSVTMGRAGARSAVSRAYYGIFHLARNTLRDLVAEFPASGRAHNLIPQYLQSADHPQASSAATLLSSLHSNRILADYDLSNPSVENMQHAKLQVEMALETQRLIEEFRRHCQSDQAVPDKLRVGLQKVKSAHGM